MWYKMVGDEVIQIEPREFALYYSDIRDRKIGDSSITINGEHLEVSTVFLGLDHGGGETAPILFETAILFRGNWTVLTRYQTKQQALNNHDQIVIALKQVEKNPLLLNYFKNLNWLKKILFDRVE